VQSFRDAPGGSYPQLGGAHCLTRKRPGKAMKREKTRQHAYSCGGWNVVHHLKRQAAFYVQSEVGFTDARHTHGLGWMINLCDRHPKGVSHIHAGKLLAKQRERFAPVADPRLRPSVAAQGDLGSFCHSASLTSSICSALRPRSTPECSWAACPMRGLHSGLL